MATVAQWLSGARPRTLPAAIAPVAAGTGAAAALHRGGGVRAALALLVALALQVGVNFANDYSDGIRGTDDHRVGPFRLTGSGAAPPRTVRAAAMAAFALAGAAGAVLVALSGTWWLLAIGAGCVAAAWFYTGGRRPYGYAGFGEVSVFVFFGLVAVLGTTYTQARRISIPAVCAALGVGSLTCAILVANNLRDIPTDAASRKQTLAVRLGEARTRTLYTALLVLPWIVLLPLLPAQPRVALTLLAIPLALRPLSAVRSRASGLELIPVLQDTGKLVLVYGLLLGLSLALPG
jgi:1,4-dihydroxy-2-naphthoate octaprenyltransferase